MPIPNLAPKVDKVWLTWKLRPTDAGPEPIEIYSNNRGYVITPELPFEIPASVAIILKKKYNTNPDNIRLVDSEPLLESQIYRADSTDENQSGWKWNHQTRKYVRHVESASSQGEQRNKLDVEMPDQHGQLESDTSDQPVSTMQKVNVIKLQVDDQNKV